MLLFLKYSKHETYFLILIFLKSYFFSIYQTSISSKLNKKTLIFKKLNFLTINNIKILIVFLIFLI